MADRKQLQFLARITVECDKEVAEGTVEHWLRSRLYDIPDVVDVSYGAVAGDLPFGLCGDCQFVAASYEQEDEVPDDSE